MLAKACGMRQNCIVLWFFVASLSWKKCCCEKLVPPNRASGGARRVSTSVQRAHRPANWFGRGASLFQCFTCSTNWGCSRNAKWFIEIVCCNTKEQQCAHCRLMLDVDGLFHKNMSKPKTEAFSDPYPHIPVLPTGKDSKIRSCNAISVHKSQICFGIFVGKTASPAATSNGRRQQSRIFFHSTEVQQRAAWSLLYTHTEHLPGEGHWSRVAQDLVMRTEEPVAHHLSSMTLPFTFWWFCHC